MAAKTREQRVLSTTDIEPMLVYRTSSPFRSAVKILRFASKYRKMIEYSIDENDVALHSPFGQLIGSRGKRQLQPKLRTRSPQGSDER